MLFLPKSINLEAHKNLSKFYWRPAVAGVRSQRNLDRERGFVPNSRDKPLFIRNKHQAADKPTALLICLLAGSSFGFHRAIEGPNIGHERPRQSTAH